MSRSDANDMLVAVVPIRAGSKGLPGKNIRPLAGMPLYMHAVRQGLRTAGRVLLTTDIAEIRQDDLPDNCILCPRPTGLAADDTPIASVITHLIESQKLLDQNILLLQATSPLRTDADVRTAIALFEQSRHDLVMSVVERDRGVLKYGMMDGDRFTGLRDTAYGFQNRQSLPPVYGPNGAVYVFSAARFMATGGFPSERVGAFEMPANRSFDIDNEADFQSVEGRMIDERSSADTRTSL